MQGFFRRIVLSLAAQFAGCSHPLCACPTRATAQSPYHTNLLMAGFDEGSGPSLYWCDYLATLHHMNICGTGYGALGQGRGCMLL